jgi:MFS family permease
MAAASVDTHSSEPLLADNIEDNADESIDPSISSKPPRQSNFTQLLSSKYVVACALFSSIGGLIFGYGIHPNVKPQLTHLDQGVISAILIMPYFRDRFALTPLMMGALTSVLELGAFFGSLTCSSLADRFSRKRTILLGCIIFIVGGSLQAIATRLWMLFLGRAIGGWGVGMLSCLAPLYMSEISPKEIRGSLLALEQFSIVSGVVIGFWYHRPSLPIS